MNNICIYDWECGMQDYIGNMINVPYHASSWQKDESEAAKDSICSYNIILLSKPFDCMARKRKTINTQEKLWKYCDYWYRADGDPRLYEQLNNYVDKMSNKFVIHPHNLLHDYNIILPKLQSWLNLPDGTIQFNPDEYWVWYQKNVNIA